MIEIGEKKVKVSPSCHDIILYLSGPKNFAKHFLNLQTHKISKLSLY